MNKFSRIAFSLAISTAALVFSIYNVARAATNLVQHAGVSSMQVEASETPVAMPTSHPSETPEPTQMSGHGSSEDHKMSESSGTSQHSDSDDKDSQMDEDSQGQSSGSSMDSHHSEDSQGQSSGSSMDSHHQESGSSSSSGSTYNDSGSSQSGSGG